MKRFLIAAALAASLPLSALAQEGIAIADSYARVAGAAAATGAAYMVIENHQAEDDRLIDVRSDVAARVEIHTHMIDAQGVARMVRVEDGLVVPAHGSHALAPGGDHVMLMGLNAPLNPGDTLSLTLVFERAGELPLEVTVAEMAGAGAMHQHGQNAKP